MSAASCLRCGDRCDGGGPCPDCASEAGSQLPLFDDGLRSSLVWIWWPPEQGEARPSGLAPVLFSWIDRGRPLGQPESPTGAIDFVDDLTFFATTWFSDKVTQGVFWENLPSTQEDDFTCVHVQCVNGGPVVQVSLSVVWNPRFSGSVLGYEDRRQNEEDPRRAYTAIRAALAGSPAAPTTGEARSRVWEARDVDG